MAESKAPLTSLTGLQDGEYITLSDVASVLRVSKTKAYEIVVGGDVEFVRIGRVVRVQVCALRAFIDARRRGGAQRKAS